MTSSVLERGCKLFWWSSITLFDTASECKYTYRPGCVVPVNEIVDDREAEGFVEIRGIWIPTPPPSSLR